MTMRYGCDIVDKEEKLINPPTPKIHLTSYIAHKKGDKCVNSDTCGCVNSEN
jgi:hypothetical protein